MEVIAKRKKGLFALYCSVGLLGVFLFIVSMNLMREDNGAENILLALASLVVVVIGAVVCAGYLKTPQEVIRFDGSNLILREGVFPVAALDKVNYTCAHARGLRYRWGKIVLKIGVQEIVYNYVADVEEVHNRLLDLRLQSEKKEERE